MRASRLPWLTLMVVVLASGVVWAGGWQYSGVGARAKAMGGAYRGLSNDGSGAYYNPGGLAFLEGNLFSGAVEFSGPRPEVTPNFNSSGYTFGHLNGETWYPVEDNVYMMGTAALFFQTEKLKGLTFGAAVYQAFDHNAVMNLFDLSPAYNDLRKIQEDNYRSNWDVVTFQPTIAYQVSEKIGIGAGLMINRADVWIDQMRFADNPYGYPVNVRPYDKIPMMTSADGYGYGFGGNVGIQVKLNEKLSAGANFIANKVFTVDGASVERVYFPHNQSIANQYIDPQVNGNRAQEDIRDTYRDGPIFVMNSDFEMDLKLPSEFGVGFAYQANENTVIAADFNYVFWSQFESLNFDILERNLANSNYVNASQAWQGMLSDMTVPLEWDDSFRFSLGLQKLVNERWTVRGGYMFDDSPIPDETFNQLFIDPGTKHHLNLGATFQLNDRISFDGAFEAIFGGSRDIGEATDVNGDGYWDNFGGEWKTSSFNSTWALNYRF